jgi:hypothetical protein
VKEGCHHLLLLLPVAAGLVAAGAEACRLSRLLPLLLLHLRCRCCGQAQGLLVSA